MPVNSNLFIPSSLKAAGRELRLALHVSVQEMPIEQFIRAWCSVAYLFPGLHPDTVGEDDNGWPRSILPFAVEAWRRFEAGEVTEDIMFPSDAQWCGLYDRMSFHVPDEVERHEFLIRKFG